MKTFLLSLCIALALYGVTYARYQNAGLSASYYKGTNFNRLVGTQIDRTLSFNTDNAVHPKLPKDRFSIKWSGFIETPSEGDYTFITYADDGVRLWVDGTTIIDDWNPHPETRNEGTIALSKGKHAVEVHYFDDQAKAKLNLHWTTPEITEEKRIPTSAFKYR